MILSAAGAKNVGDQSVAGLMNGATAAANPSSVEAFERALRPGK